MHDGRLTLRKPLLPWKQRRSCRTITPIRSYTLPSLSERKMVELSISGEVFSNSPAPTRVSERFCLNSAWVKVQGTQAVPAVQRSLGKCAQCEHRVYFPGPIRVFSPYQFGPIGVLSRNERNRFFTPAALTNKIPIP